MSPLKSLDQLRLEGFFGIAFGVHPVWPAMEAQIFDGVVPWGVTFSEELRQLFFQGDVRKLGLGFPWIEVFVSYAVLETRVIAGIGEVLKITPQPNESGGVPVWFVKSPDGRISPASFSNTPF